MTDTLDALWHNIKSAFDTGDSIAQHACMDAIRARLTAGDAAIKRVAELEAEAMVAAERKRNNDADMLAAIRKSEADLAAARAEIERKDAALRLVRESPHVTMGLHFLVTKALASENLV